MSVVRLLSVLHTCRCGGATCIFGFFRESWGYGGDMGGKGRIWIFLLFRARYLLELIGNFGIGHRNGKKEFVLIVWRMIWYDVVPFKTSECVSIDSSNL